MNRSNAAGTGSGVHHWVLRKNCSFTPRQVLYFYLSLTAVSISIALWFTWRGLWLVLPYAVVENLVLAIALIVYARHALDRECVWLHDGHIRVDVIRGDRITQYRFPANFTHLEWRGKRGDILWLRHGHQEVRVGSFLTPRGRRRFAFELQRALRLQSAPPTGAQASGLSPEMAHSQT